MIHTRNYRTALDQLLSADAVNPWLYSLALFVLTVVCRLPFTSKLLYDQDAVQFALALENYDVYLQQPHPPGYFLYVMAGKAINLFAQNGNASFVLLSVIASGLTVVAIYQLGRTLFDRETGLWAATFALTSPLLWYYGEVALTYVVASFFHNRTYAVWNAGIISRGHFLLALLGNTAYGVGLGMIFLLFGLYVLFRTGNRRYIPITKVLFFVVWLVPAFLFHVVVFMNPDQAGYSVFFLPPLFVLIWPATKYVLVEIGRVLGRQTLGATATCRTWMLGLISASALFFLVSNSVVSAKGIREHDKNLSVILGGIAKNFSPNDTIVVDEKSYQLYNYRHIQYYLRRYTVYLTALSESHGERWHIFGGQNGRTFVTERLDISPRIRYVVYLTNPLDRSYVEALEAKGFRRLQLDESSALFYQLRK